MPKYRITAPDGRQFDIEGEGTADQALAHFQAQYAQTQQAQPAPQQQTAAPAPPPEQNKWMGALQKAGNFAGEFLNPLNQMDAALTMGRGMVAYPAGAAAGLAGIVGDATGLWKNDPAETERKVSSFIGGQPLTSPNTPQQLAVSAPGRLISGAGELLSRVPGIKGAPYLEDISKRLPEAAANALALKGALKAREAAQQPNLNPPPQPPAVPEPTDLQKAAGLLEEHDIPTYRYQVSQNPTLQNAQAAVDQLPFSGAKSAQVKQGTAFNRAVLKLAGASDDATKATPEVMGRLQSALGKNLDAIENKASFPVPMKEIDSVMNDARLVLSDQQMGTLERQVSNMYALEAKNGGELSGGAYAAIKRSLDKLSAGSDTDVAGYAKDLRSALQDGLQQTLSPEDTAFYAKTRAQYQMMKQIEGAIDEAGNISPSKLSNVFRQKANRYQGIYGKGEQKLVQLANAAKQIIPEKIPNSGTPQRLMYMALLGGGALANPLAAALAATGGLGLPRLLRKLPSGAVKPPPVVPPAP